MTENEARQVVLLQAHEDGGLPWNAPRAGANEPLWTADDRAWATRQALAATGEQTSPERFVVVRAGIALQRLLPKAAAAKKWLSPPWWQATWAWLACLAGAVGLAAGLAVDQLGPPTRVALLAPSVWLVVGWNLVVYLCLPMPWSGLHRWASRRLVGREQRRGAVGPASLWAQHAAPLTLARVSCVLHAAAAGMGLGVIASLYFRGLVLDYRIGWESTFLLDHHMQSLLGLLMAPALWLSHQALPDVAPLRLGPGVAATATAAPWIHLFATTLLALVVAPRLLLAAWAGWRAQRRSRRFPLDLDTPYFQCLHPLMRPGQDHRLRLLCVAAAGVQVPPLLGRAWATLPLWPADPTAPATDPPWLQSDDGEALWLYRPPAGWPAHGARGAAPRPRPWYGLGALRFGQRVDPVQRALRKGVNAVLLVGPAGTVPSQALLALGRPVLVLEDSPHPEAPALPLRALAASGVPDGLLLSALAQRLDGDPRMQSLLSSWRRRHDALRAAVARQLAEDLATWAGQRETLPAQGLFSFGPDAAAAAAAQTRLSQAFEAHWPGLAQRLLALPAQHELPPPGLPDDSEAVVDGTGAQTALVSLPSAWPAVRHRVEARTGALVGSVLTAALSGLAADLMSGGLSLGMGTLVGAAVGVLGGAGAAKGVNVVRGTDHSFVTWPDNALNCFAHEALLQALASVWNQWPERLPPLPLTAFKAVWAQRSPKLVAPGEAALLTRALVPVFEAWLYEALVQAQAQVQARAPTPARAPARVQTRVG